MTKDRQNEGYETKDKVTDDKIRKNGMKTVTPVSPEAPPPANLPSSPPAASPAPSTFKPDLHFSNCLMKMQNENGWFKEALKKHQQQGNVNIVKEQLTKALKKFMKEKELKARGQHALQKENRENTDPKGGSKADSGSGKNLNGRSEDNCNAAPPPTHLPGPSCSVPAGLSSLPTSDAAKVSGAGPTITGNTRTDGELISDDEYDAEVAGCFRDDNTEKDNNGNGKDAISGGEDNVNNKKKSAQGNRRASDSSTLPVTNSLLTLCSNYKDAESSRIIIRRSAEKGRILLNGKKRSLSLDQLGDYEVSDDDAEESRNDNKRKRILLEKARCSSSNEQDVQNMEAVDVPTWNVNHRQSEAAQTSECNDSTVPNFLSTPAAPTSTSSSEPSNVQMDSSSKEKETESDQSALVPPTSAAIPPAMPPATIQAESLAISNPQGISPDIQVNTAANTSTAPPSVQTGTGPVNPNNQETIADPVSVEEDQIESMEVDEPQASTSSASQINSTIPPQDAPSNTSKSPNKRKLDELIVHYYEAMGWSPQPLHESEDEDVIDLNTLEDSEVAEPVPSPASVQDLLDDDPDDLQVPAPPPQEIESGTETETIPSDQNSFTSETGTEAGNRLSSSSTEELPSIQIRTDIFDVEAISSQDDHATPGEVSAAAAALLPLLQGYEQTEENQAAASIHQQIINLQKALEAHKKLFQPAAFSSLANSEKKQAVDKLRSDLFETFENFSANTMSMQRSNPQIGIDPPLHINMGVECDMQELVAFFEVLFDAMMFLKNPQNVDEGIRGVTVMITKRVMRILYLFMVAKGGTPNEQDGKYRAVVATITSANQKSPVFTSVQDTAAKIRLLQGLWDRIRTSSTGLEYEQFAALDYTILKPSELLQRLSKLKESIAKRYPSKAVAVAVPRPQQGPSGGLQQLPSSSNTMQVQNQVYPQHQQMSIVRPTVNQLQRGQSMLFSTTLANAIAAASNCRMEARAQAQGQLQLQCPQQLQQPKPFVLSKEGYNQQLAHQQRMQSRQRQSQLQATLINQQATSVAMTSLPYKNPHHQNQMRSQQQTPIYVGGRVQHLKQVPVATATRRGSQDTFQGPSSSQSVQPQQPRQVINQGQPRPYLGAPMQQSASVRGSLQNRLGNRNSPPGQQQQPPQNSIRRNITISSSGQPMSSVSELTITACRQQNVRVQGNSGFLSAPSQIPAVPSPRVNPVVSRRPSSEIYSQQQMDTVGEMIDSEIRRMLGGFPCSQPTTPPNQTGNAQNRQQIAGGLYSTFENVATEFTPSSTASTRTNSNQGGPSSSNLSMPEL